MWRGAESIIRWSNQQESIPEDVCYVWKHCSLSLPLGLLLLSTVLKHCAKLSKDRVTHCRQMRTFLSSSSTNADILMMLISLGIKRLRSPAPVSKHQQLLGM